MNLSLCPFRTHLTHYPGLPFHPVRPLQPQVEAMCKFGVDLCWSLHRTKDRHPVPMWECSSPVIGHCIEGGKWKGHMLPHTQWNGEDGRTWTCTMNIKVVQCLLSEYPFGMMGMMGSLWYDGFSVLPWLCEQLRPLWHTRLDSGMLQTPVWAYVIVYSITTTVLAYGNKNQPAWL